MLADLKFAFRQLVKSPGFTFTAVLTLALGIGVNTSMYSLADAMLYRLAPYPHPEQLVRIWETSPENDSGTFALQDLDDLRAYSTSLTALTTFTWMRDTVAEPGQPTERVQAVYVSREYFAICGMQPALGRMFTAEEEKQGHGNVTVLSHEFWLRRFNGDPGVIGRTIRLNAEPATIIGVMPAGYQYRMMGGTNDLIRPLALPNYFYETRRVRNLTGLARLKPGVTLAQATAELAPFAARLAKEHPELSGHHGIRLEPLHVSANPPFYRRLSWMLLALSGLVLLLACANLAHLQLARATARTREFALRAALGASRLQLVRQRLVESLLLALAGGGLGLILASWINEVLERSVVYDGDHWLELPLAPGIFGFALLASLFTAVLFGLAPAWLASHTDLNDALKQQSRGSTVGRGPQRVAHVLIVAETAFALVLLGAAGVVLHGFAKFLSADRGWDTKGILTAQITLPDSTRYNSLESKREFHRKLETRLAAIPGVEHEALVTLLPVFTYGAVNPLRIEGRTVVVDGEQPLASYTMVTHDYLAAVKIPLVEGSFFSADIGADSPPVVVVNESLARHFWPDGSAVGKRIAGLEGDVQTWRQIIGVVRDVELAGNVENPVTRFQVYCPLIHDPWGFFAIVLRGPAPDALAKELRRAVAETDPDVVAERIFTIPQMLHEDDHDIILASRALAGFAFLGLVIAAVGLYGIVSNIVAQRTTEFGIRIALGAQSHEVLWQAVRRGLYLGLIGLVIGLAGALGAGRFLSTFMPRVDCADPVGLAVVAGLLLGVIILACWLPARRATKVDPMTALRAE